MLGAPQLGSSVAQHTCLHPRGVGGQAQADVSMTSKRGDPNVTCPYIESLQMKVLPRTQR